MAKKFAFAFRDFNSEKILQRHFFDGLNLPRDIDDYGVLKSLHENAHIALRADDVKQCEKIIHTLEETEKKVCKYSIRIKKHIDRFLAISQQITGRILADDTNDFEKMRRIGKRAVTLSEKYVAIAQKVGELEHEIQNRIQTLDWQMTLHGRKKFADNLRTARSKLKLTQRQLGNVVGISNVAIANYERCVTEPTLKNLCRLCDGLKISADKLIGRI